MAGKKCGVGMNITSEQVPCAVDCRLGGRTHTRVCIPCDVLLARSPSPCS